MSIRYCFHKKLLMSLKILTILFVIFNCNSARSYECRDGFVTFELITGYVFTAPSETVTMLPGILHLIECMDRCLSNHTCKSLNFETGLCVLLSTSSHERPEALTQSQFPVFTIYAQKICLRDKSCDRGWAFERVNGYELKKLDKKKVKVTSRVECMQLCLNEIEFECRSVNYDNENNDCALSDMDRHTININNDHRSRNYGPSSGTVDYIENNCIKEPTKLCDFRPISGRILKTVDSIYQNVKTVEECREKCLNSPYRCHSFDFGDPSNSVCRTSHLDENSLAHIEEPYHEVTGATTYEILSCYNVTILCHSREMIAIVKSSKIFDGKIYAKSKPNICVNDVSNSLEFEIKMKYNDVECDVKQSVHGQFSNDIVIQHHDMIVTTKDLGLNIHCKYDLSNRTITNNVNLSVDGDVDATGRQSVTVSSPNVTMKITDKSGSDISSAQVGDPLMLRFEILEVSSPYEIFVRELVAVDGQDSAEILLIDSLGCPTDASILGPMNKVGGNGHIIEGHFDAFKFPTSEMVQFRALVTPCLPTCEPVKCHIKAFDGIEREMDSFGRKRRRRRSDSSNSTENEEIVIHQTIQISDKFEFGRNDRKRGKSSDDSLKSEIHSIDDKIDKSSGDCINIIGLVFACSCFLLAQLVLILTWACLRKRTLNTHIIDRKLMHANIASHNYDMFYPVMTTKHA